MVIRIPEVMAEELLRVARVLDEAEKSPVTGKTEVGSDSHVTGDKSMKEVAMKDAVDSFLMTIPPRDRRNAKKLLYKFIESIDEF